MGDGDNFEKVEPQLNLNLSDPHEYYIYRPDTDVVKLSMGVHGAGTPFEVTEFEDERFYEIEGGFWKRGEVGVDGKGVFIVFYRMKGEFKGYEAY